MVYLYVSRYVQTYFYYNLLVRVCLRCENTNIGVLLCF